MTTPDRRGDVTRALDGLAVDGTDGVAAALLKAGATGVRHEGAACPIANYVAEQTGVEIQVSVASWFFDTHPDGSYGGLLPLAVTKFVHRFDRGEHPELDRTQPEEP